MSFSWPWALLALLILPLLLAVWWLSRRRRKRNAVHVTSVALLKAALPGHSRWRRRVPVALLTAGLFVLCLGAARPQATLPVPSSSETIMLAIDTSGSMCATDVKPNRITAAERAAASFIRSQAGGPRIGIVVFSGDAVILVPPTTDTQRLVSALGGLSAGGATAIGEAIVTSLDAIAQADPGVAPTGAKVKRAPHASYADDVIVVLTDGSSNRGIAPPAAARQAAARGVRVFTIGYGTSNPTQLACGPAQFGGYSGLGSSSGRNPFQADDTALVQISRTTGGAFYRAQDASQLSSALARLPAALTIVHKRVDVAYAFAALGGLLVALAVALSLWWNRVRRPARVSDR